MKEKVEKLRKELFDKLSSIEEGIHIKLDYDPDILELILFKTIDGELIIDEYGKRKDTAKYAYNRKVLSKIDLSDISFDNFDAKGFDFTGLYGVRLNPQTIWDKNLKGSVLNGVEFIGSFFKAKIEGANFTGSKGAIIDLALYDGKEANKITWQHYSLNNCKFSGVIFTSPIKDIRLYSYHFFDENKDTMWSSPSIQGTDFTGSKGAIIDVNDIKDLHNCNLTDALIVGEIKQSHYINGTNFTGAKQKVIGPFSKQITINPSCENEYKDYTSTNFNGIRFTKPFGKCHLDKTNFTGSEGAIIDLRLVDDESDISSVNFTDAKVIGKNGEEILVTEDGRLSRQVENTIDKLLNIEHNSALIKKEELEKAREELMKENRRKIKDKISELLNLVKTSEMLGIEPHKLYGTIPIEQDLFLVQIDDHYEINRDIIDTSLLRFFNLSLIDFTNVKVSGIDFRYSKANIDPQKVWNKDISYSTFDNSNISPFDNFNEVNTECTNFEE